MRTSRQNLVGTLLLGSRGAWALSTAGCGDPTSSIEGVLSDRNACVPGSGVQCRPWEITVDGNRDCLEKSTTNVFPPTGADWVIVERSYGENCKGFLQAAWTKAYKVGAQASDKCVYSCPAGHPQRTCGAVVEDLLTDCELGRTDKDFSEIWYCASTTWPGAGYTSVAPGGAPATPGAPGEPAKPGEPPVIPPVASPTTATTTKTKTTRVPTPVPTRDVRSGERFFPLIAIGVPLVYNNYGDHDPKGLIFAHARNKEHLLQVIDDYPDRLAAKNLTVDPVITPLVLRARVGERVIIQLENLIPDRFVGIHLNAAGYNTSSDGSAVGKNPHSLVAPNGTREYVWELEHEGPFFFQDAGDLNGGKEGTNSHGLFGAIIVEEAHAVWTDPETGAELIDGPYADVHPPKRGRQARNNLPGWGSDPPKYPPDEASYREFVVFIHDEVEAYNPDLEEVPSPCGADAPSAQMSMRKPANAPEVEVGGAADAAAAEMPHAAEQIVLGALAEAAEQADKDLEGLPGLRAVEIMPISYRSEPMLNRLRIMHKRYNRGEYKDDPDAPHDEEVHHSSWMFGDPVTPILRNYIGDPLRIHVFHAGVKETHVFHWHVHQWHANYKDRTSPLIDAMLLGPQMAYTAVGLYGSGSRLLNPGDVIWHCHLYPHFHHGMWGIQRSYDTLQNGTMKYPDGTQIRPLLPLPDRERPPLPTAEKPGFPNFIAGKMGKKSPRVPWPESKFGPVPEGYTYRPATELEVAAMNDDPVPGGLFVKIPFSRALPSVQYNISVIERKTKLNEHGWFVDRATMFIMDNEIPDVDPSEPYPYEPFVARANKGQVIDITAINRLPKKSLANRHDNALPVCGAIGYQGESSFHVHLVKFDVMSADGSSTGWNYISAPKAGEKFYYKWWADEEFGSIFFHDHLFANTRQKAGLYGNMVIEPEGSKYFNPRTNAPMIAGLEARIETPTDSYREFAFSFGDFVPAFNGSLSQAIRPPTAPGGMDDPGISMIGYRAEDLNYRASRGNPETWFSSRKFKEPVTHLYEAYPGDKIILRIVQGSHEEDHSFQIYGMKWREFLDNPTSKWTNQKSIGISEATNLWIDRTYGPGDHMYKLSGINDLWTGNWGIIRVHDGIRPNLPLLSSNRKPNFRPLSNIFSLNSAAGMKTREYRVVATRRQIDYDSDLSDPFGIMYEVDSYKEPDGAWQAVSSFGKKPEPLVLRVRKGELLKIHLENRLITSMKKEPAYARIAVENDARNVSNHISIHVDVLQFDVRDSMGVNLGWNPDQTVPPGQWKTYTYHADEEVGAVPMHDMADVRNHRRHGAIGAVVVLEHDAVPDQWVGTSTVIRVPSTGLIYDQSVLVVQDGLRHFKNGDLTMNVLDTPVSDEDEDRGQKGINYRSCPTHRRVNETHVLFDSPGALVLPGRAGRRHKISVIGGTERERMMTIHIHGHTWKRWPTPGVASPYVSTIDGITSGSAVLIDLENPVEGDWLIRNGVSLFGVTDGMWAILRNGPAQAETLEEKPRKSSIQLPPKTTPTSVPNVTKTPTADASKSVDSSVSINEATRIPTVMPSSSAKASQPTTASVPTSEHRDATSPAVGNLPSLPILTTVVLIGLGGFFLGRGF
ncbi:uncharacterized protein EV422DRAFT_539939 [Fimicolochytrium jonesii]|uniref:uncharacterized protein n=1 Tax=Fimicolochytrium jonesii TaxID=1396493 RepID=UPI0022FE14F1|nr:uncharacterized protein EV422DRAFT_539939 [Fimicolochytrium jonesii]KAI8817793.1 hypothetical protein EV422DRAFT_539939 [Fimicolochytrium jonesii]